MFESPLVKKIVALALEEDLSQGDVTSELTVAEGKLGRAEVVAKERLLICGLPIIETILSLLPGGNRCAVKFLVPEGSVVSRGTVVAHVSGPVRALLSAERTILNFLQRLSGVATGTKLICENAHGLKVLDSRKTTPGLRALEKYAVRVGGGNNHRFSLGDMILVKNNHVDANGGSMQKTLSRIAAHKPPYMPLEVEVRDLKELKDALMFHPTVVMLDNMSDREISQSMRVIRDSGSSCLVEISGGVTAERLPRLKRLGVSIVSMGSLTTRAQNVDISMRIV